jgi:hypothetical protein
MIQDLAEVEARRPFVQFERVPVENTLASREQGHYVAVDRDRAYITPPGSKDKMIYDVDTWFRLLEDDVRNNRIPREWVESYKKQYDFWKQGQEMPLEGVPIRGWGMLSPAQQETLIRLHVLTVETLAIANEELIRRIGMGGMDMKNKAEAWLKETKGKGKLTMEMAALKKENEILKASLANLEAKFEEIKNAPAFAPIAQDDEAINLSDILQ